MRFQLKLFATLLCAVAVAACGDDDGNGTGGTGGSGGTAGTGGSGETSTVTGVVYYYEEGYPAVQGATVEVYDSTLSTTTDANGNFTLQDVPSGDRFFITSAEGSWSVVDYWFVPDETANGVELLLVRDAEVARYATSIDRPINDNHAMVDIFFFGAQGGETGDIDAESDPPFTFDVWDAVDQQSVIADVDGFGELVFPNINPPTGLVDATVMPSRCSIDETPGLEYPIFPKSITIIYAVCQ